MAVFAASALAVAWLCLASPSRKLPLVSSAREAGLALPLGALAVFVAGSLLERAGRRRRGSSPRVLCAIAVGLAVALAGALVIPGLRSRAVTLIEAAVLFLSAVSLGSFLLERLRFRPASGAEGLALAGALGLGALASAFFLLGQVGLFRGWVLTLVTLAGLPLGLRPAGALAERLFEGAGRLLRGAGLAGCSLLVLIGLVYLLRLVHCFSPPTFGFSDYDGLEYHIAAPLEWLRSGWVSFLPHNAYANMPAAAEMLYAPGLALAPGRWGGFHFARLVGLGASELATLAVFAGARRLAGTRSALVAAAIFFCGAWLSDLTVNVYVEPVLLLFATAAWLAFTAAVARGRFDLRRLASAGLLAGAACAVKYPALVTVALPLAAAALAAGLLRTLGRRRAGRPDPGSAPARPPILSRSLAGAALAGGLSLAVVAPWYLRNWIAGGNPVYPLAGSVFSSPYWDEGKQARWTREHSPKASPAVAIRNLVVGRKGAGLENVRSGPLLAVFLPLAAWGAWARRRRGVGWIALFAAIFIATWATQTHQVERFLFPAYGLLAILAAAGAAALPRRGAGTLAGGAVLLGVMAFAPAQYSLVRRERRLRRGVNVPYTMMLGFAEDDYGYFRSGYWAVIDEVNRLPDGSKVLLLGEARPAIFAGPVVYATVWDTHPLEAALREAPDAGAAAARLRAQGVTHLLVNWDEFDRLARSYGLMDLDAAARERLRVMELYDMRKLGAWGDPCGKSPLTGRSRKVVELWELKPVAGQR